jgi:anti-sigma B factor antagonist
MKILHRDPQTLEVQGLLELTAANAAQLRDDIRAALKPSNTWLEIDVSGVTFMDSSGLGALISLHKSMRSQNGALRLLNPSTNVRQILELTRLHRVLEIQNN